MPEKIKNKNKMRWYYYTINVSQCHNTMNAVMLSCITGDQGTSDKPQIPPSQPPQEVGCADKISVFSLKQAIAKWLLIKPCVWVTLGATRSTKISLYYESKSNNEYSGIFLRTPRFILRNICSSIKMLYKAGSRDFILLVATDILRSNISILFV